MRKLVMAMMVLFAVGRALALTPMGPPRAELEKGKRSLGFLFSSSEMDLDISGYGMTEEMSDTESTAYLVKAGYGLSDGFEIYSLLGFADMTSEDYKGNSEFAWGFGTKFTLAESAQVTWGGLFQMVSLSSDGSISGDVPGFGWQTIDVDVQLYEIQIAFGPTYTTEAFSIYGGPFLHFVSGDLDGSALGVTVEFDIEQKSEFGGYVGTQFELNKSTAVFIEHQMTGDASAIAGGFVWRF